MVIGINVSHIRDWLQPPVIMNWMSSCENECTDGLMFVIVLDLVRLVFSAKLLVLFVFFYYHSLSLVLFIL